MTTNNTIVSEIENIFRNNNKDNIIPRRFILRLAEDAAKFLISQKWAERSLLSDLDLFSYIPCFEFESVDVKECPSIEFRRCNKLMKSKNPLPELIFSKLGGTIKDIVALDGNYRFNFVDEQQYRRNKSRKYSIKNEVYLYLGVDNHLYIPDAEIYSVDLTVLTTDKDAAQNCSECSEKIKCKSKWDSEFVCPSKLIEAVKDMVVQRLGITKQVREDQNPNGLENG